ncbi:MAG: DUF2214 family protein, partial [Hyphomonadaceae bacterium]
MLTDALLSYAHFAFVLILAGALAAEAFILRLRVDARVALLLARVDAFYGIAAIGVIAAGFARVYFGLKGADFYFEQHWFWTKIALFVIVGLLSVPPTLQFFKWRKAARADAGFVADEKQVKAVKRFIMIELHVLALVPLAAAFMARG